MSIIQDVSSSVLVDWKVLDLCVIKPSFMNFLCFSTVFIATWSTTRILRSFERILIIFRASITTIFFLFRACCINIYVLLVKIFDIILVSPRIFFYFLFTLLKILSYLLFFVTTQYLYFFFFVKFELSSFKSFWYLLERSIILLYFALIKADFLFQSLH